MDIFSFFRKKDTSQPKRPVLHEVYSEWCVESENNREYLEQFFDVKNYDLSNQLKIIPSCNGCFSQYRCVTGIHVRNYWLARQAGLIRTDIKPVNQNSEIENPTPTVIKHPDSRFDSIE